MRWIVVFCVAAGVLLSPVAARGQMEKYEFWDLRRAAKQCGYRHQLMEDDGIAHWVPEFLEVKELILRRATERGATERQLRELEEFFERGRQQAIEKGFAGSRKREPKDDEQRQAGMRALNMMLERCLVMREAE